METLMPLLLFYLLACLFMAISAMLAGIQWSEANGVGQYLQLLLQKPFIIVVTVAVFVLSGVLTQIGKYHFSLSYYQISIIWLATSWVALITLWLFYDITPSRAELIGALVCNLGLAISIIGRAEQGSLLL